jgi:hypothetical protein
MGCDMATKTGTREIGPDGWPLDLPSEAEQAAERERQFQADMRAFEARWLAGDLTAVAEAVRVLCLHRDGPKWLENAPAVVVARAMAEDEKRLRRKWQEYRLRWEMVTERYERDDELSRSAKAQVERVRALIAVKPTNEKEMKEQARLIELWSELVEAARDDQFTRMERTRAAVSEALGEGKGNTPGAIKYAYDIVEAAGGEPAMFEDYLAILRERGESDD